MRHPADFSTSKESEQTLISEASRNTNLIFAEILNTETLLDYWDISRGVISSRAGGAAAPLTLAIGQIF